jgi:hypothetical protein
VNGAGRLLDNMRNKVTKMSDFLLINNRANNKNTEFVFVCISDKDVLSVVAFGTSFLLKEEENG